MWTWMCWHSIKCAEKNELQQIIWPILCCDFNSKKIILTKMDWRVNNAAKDVLHHLSSTLFFFSVPFFSLTHSHIHTICMMYLAKRVLDFRSVQSNGEICVQWLLLLQLRKENATRIPKRPRNKSHKFHDFLLPLIVMLCILTFFSAAMIVCTRKMKYINSYYMRSWIVINRFKKSCFCINSISISNRCSMFDSRSISPRRWW